MSSRQMIPLLEPVLWEPGLTGAFPGQVSYRELGQSKVPITFCWCPPLPPRESFQMGSPPEEPERRENEKQRKVPMPKGFWLAQHPVSQAQWQAVMGENPSHFQNSDGSAPVDQVSWKDAQDFCRKVGLRLPLEAEWEYACRAGSRRPFGIGGGFDLNAQLANFDGEEPYGSGQNAFKWLKRDRTIPAGCFPPNAWGFHDMHGQLWEWCEDLLEVEVRVLRGGGWISRGGGARSAIRGCDPEFRSGSIGFRPCPSSTSPAPEAKAERGKEWSEGRAK